MLKITLKRSMIGEVPKNRLTAQALGLRKTGRFVYQEDTPSVRGMIHQIKEFLTVETVEGVTKVRKRQGKAAESTSVAMTEPKKTTKKKTAKEATSE
jgi:large subunit ribosomal protein L30